MKKFTFVPIAIFTLTMLLAGCTPSEPKVVIHGIEISKMCQDGCKADLEKDPFKNLEACQVSCQEVNNMYKKQYDERVESK